MCKAPESRLKAEGELVVELKPKVAREGGWNFGPILSRKAKAFAGAAITNSNQLTCPEITTSSTKLAMTQAPVTAARGQGGNLAIPQMPVEVNCVRAI